MAERKKKDEAKERVEPAAKPPVRDSGPVEGATEEPGGSPADEASVEEPAAEEKPKRGRKKAVELEPAAEVEVEAVAEAPAEEPEAAPAEEPAPEPVAETEPKQAPAPEEEEASQEAPSAEPAKRARRKRVPRAERRQRPKAKRPESRERKPIVRLPKPERERGRTQERRGVVVSNAMDKTIVVRVDTLKAHPRYKKIIRRSTKFHAHDERNEANVGDVVRIVETRPLSKTKRWRLVEIIEAAK